jgi:hypothetical protein
LKTTDKLNQQQQHELWRTAAVNQYMNSTLLVSSSGELACELLYFGKKLWGTSVVNKHKESLMELKMQLWILQPPGASLVAEVLKLVQYFWSSGNELFLKLV